MSERIVLITDYTWPSTQPEAEVLAKIGAKLLIAQSGTEEEFLELVPQADAILTCFAISDSGRTQITGDWTLWYWSR